MKIPVIQMVILFKSLPLWGHCTTLQLFTITNQEQLLHNGFQTLKMSVVVEIRTVLNKFLSPFREVSKAIKKVFSPSLEILVRIANAFSTTFRTRKI